MPKRLQTKVDLLEQLARPEWLPASEQALWDSLSTSTKRFFNGGYSSETLLHALFAAMPDDLRQQVIDRLEGR